MSTIPRKPSGAGLAWALLIALLSGGCVSKSKADAQARQAFLAGQRQAFMQLQQQLREPSVSFIGPVNHSIVKWWQGLTLAQAVMDAGYAAADDPRGIVIRRSGQEIIFDPKRLLRGEAFLLEAGDVIELQP